MLEHTTYETYLRILREELVPALGCTEPIAIALASAKAKEALGAMPEKITAACSGNIVKNAKGVIVPTTGNMKGIGTSAVLGAVLYRIIIAAALAANVGAQNFKLVSAVIVAAAISWPSVREKLQLYRLRREVQKRG